MADHANTNTPNSQRNPDDETLSHLSYRIAVGFGSIALLLGYLQIKHQTDLFQSAHVIVHASLVAGTLAIISLLRLPTFPDKDLRQIFRYAANVSGSLWAILLLLLLSPILAWTLLVLWAIGAAQSGRKVYPCVQNLRQPATNEATTATNRATAMQPQQQQV